MGILDRFAKHKKKAQPIRPEPEGEPELPYVEGEDDSLSTIWRDMQPEDCAEWLEYLGLDPASGMKTYEELSVTEKTKLYNDLSYEGHS